MDDKRRASDEADDKEPGTLPLFSQQTEDDEPEFWSGEDLERAYQEALKALDQFEEAIPSAREALDFETNQEDSEAGPMLYPFLGAAGKSPSTETSASKPDGEHGG